MKILLAVIAALFSFNVQAVEPYGIVDVGAATFTKNGQSMTGALGSVGIGMPVNKWLSGEARLSYAQGSAVTEPSSVDCSFKHVKRSCPVAATKASWDETFGDISAVGRYAITQKVDLTGRVGAQYVDGVTHGLLGAGVHYTVTKAIHLRGAIEGSGDMRTARAGITFAF